VNIVRILLIGKKNLSHERVIHEQLTDSSSHFYRFVRAAQLQNGLRLLDTRPVDIVLLDFDLLDSAGLKTLRAVRQKNRKIPLIVLAEEISERQEIEAAKRGADDSLIYKELDAGRLGRAIGQALQRKSLIETLRESQTLTSIILDSSPNPLVVTNLDSSISYVNATFEEITGFSADEVKGLKMPYPWWPKEKNEEFEQIYVKGDRGIPHRFERCFRKKDGVPFWVTVSLTPVRQSGQILFYLANWDDITHRKSIEDALKDSEQKFRALFEQGQDGLVLINREAIIVDWNEAASRITGLPRAEVLGKPIWDVHHGLLLHPDVNSENQHRMRAEITKILGDPSRSSQILTGRIQNALNGPRTVLIRTFQIQCSNEQFLFTIIRDTTDLQQSEKELGAARERLRSFSVYLQDLLENERKLISMELHDQLGQMLTALKIDLSWMAKRLPRDNDLLLQKATSMQSMIDESEKVVKRITSDLRPVLLDGVGLIPAIESMVIQFQERTGIKCKLTLPRGDFDLGKRCSIDVYRIFQEAINNISRHAGATRVSAVIKIFSEDLSICIRDNGRGITSQELANGDSFGIMSMQERARKWGGKLEIKGTPGKGTILNLVIPARGEQR
jgi:PAS domain S-box-containing protein